MLSVALFASILATEASDRIDRAVREEMDAQRIPGLSVAIVRDGKLLYSKGFGLANVELGVKATDKTVYQIQSVTKQFTASAILLLAQEGKLGLDDPLSKHLDKTPDSWSEVTIRHLLTHTSGIKDFINEPTQSLKVEVSEQEVFDATASRPLNFKTGEQYQYSNTNYHLLAMVIRKLTGKAYGEVLAERIFGPLKMNDTSIVSLSGIVERRAAGYLMESGKMRNGEYVAQSVLAYAGGGVVSTVLDMAKWDIALDGDAILNPDSKRQMWSPMRLRGGGVSPYGFGWAIGTLNGHREFAHSGGHVTGFTSFYAKYPDDRLTVLVLTNAGWGNPARIARLIAGAVVPALKPQEPKPIEDKEPGVRALLEKVLGQARAQKLDMSLMSEKMKQVLTPEMVWQGAEMLRDFGKVLKIELIKRETVGGDKVSIYRIQFEKAKILCVLALGEDGLINGLQFTL